MATQKVVLEVDVDEKGAVTGIRSVGAELDKVKDKAKEVKKESSGAFGFLEVISPRAASALKNVQGGVKGLIGGFKGLRAALISTGIGALVVLLGSLISYFTQTKRGSEALSRGMAYLGGVVSVIKDAFSALGEAIVWAFENPQQAMGEITVFVLDLYNWVKELGNFIGGFFIKQWLTLKANVLSAAIEVKKFFGSPTGELEAALVQTQIEISNVAKEMSKSADAIIQPFKDAASAIGDMIDRMDEAGDKALALEARNQKLVDSQRALNVETARSRADIKELNKIAEDTTLTYEERIAAAQKAGEIEQNLMNRRLALAAENVRIIKQQNALSESTAEDLDRLADAEIELANIRMESNELQTTLMAKENALTKEFAQKTLDEKMKLSEEEQRILMETEEVRQALVRDGIEKELQEVDKKYDELFLKANGNHELEKQLIESQQADINAIYQKYREADRAAQKVIDDKKLEDERKLQEGKRQLAATTIEAISTLADLAAGQDEQRARKAFAVTKALNLAQAIANTYAAVTAVLKDPTLVGPSRFIAAANAGLIGLTNVAKIAATKFGGGASGGAGGGGGLGSVGQAPAATAVPTLDLGLNGQQQQTPIPAYVIGQQVQNDMEARTRVQDLARL